MIKAYHNTFSNEELSILSLLCHTLQWTNLSSSLILLQDLNIKIIDNRYHFFREMKNVFLWLKSLSDYSDHEPNKGEDFLYSEKLQF
jgi:hypothetical protein